MMPFAIRTLSCLLCLGGMLSVTAQGQELTDGDPAALIDVLGSDASLFEKAKACQQLSIIGDAAAVPALAELLPHPELTGYARYGLESIPGKASLAALRDALPTVEGEALIGIIGSLGNRRDEEASEPLIDLLDKPNAREAAAFALGQIGTKHAATALQERLVKGSDVNSLTRGVLRCAQRRLEADDAQTARQLYETLRAAEVDRHTELAAIQGLIRAGKGQAGELLRQQLTSDADDAFRMALTTIRSDGIALTEQDAALLFSLPAKRQALFITALRDHAAKEVVPQIISAGREGTEDVQVEAVRAVAALDSRAALPFLWELAASQNSRVGEAAQQALADIDSAEVDERIVQLLQSSAQRGLGIELAERRHLAAANPMLLEIAKQSGSANRTAAIEALGATVRQPQFAELLELALHSTDDAVAEAARQSVAAACERLPKAACATQLGEAIAEVQTEQTGFLFDRLAQIAGPTALEIVTLAAQSDNSQLQDEATRVLGEWPSAEAADPLFQLASTLEDRKYQLRALRGYIRIARQLDMTLDERMQVCRNALRLASRADEKELVLEVIARHRAPAGLSIAANLLDDPEVSERAATVIVNTAERMEDAPEEQLREPLEAVIAKTRRPDIADRARERLK